MSVQDENEYEDLLGLWSDLESGLGVLLSNPLSVREFETARASVRPLAA